MTRKHKILTQFFVQSGKELCDWLYN